MVVLSETGLYQIQHGRQWIYDDEPGLHHEYTEHEGVESLSEQEKFELYAMLRDVRRLQNECHNMMMEAQSRRSMLLNEAMSNLIKAGDCIRQVYSED